MNAVRIRTAARRAAASRLTAQVLLGALVPGRAARGSAALCRLDPPDLVPAAAIYHRVPGYVLRAYGHLPALEPVVGQLRAAVAEATTRHLRALGDHRRFSRVLAELGVPHLVFKGPVLAEHHHGGPDLRSYRDLDVLVPGRHLRMVVDALEAQGWPWIDRNWTLLREAVAGEVHLVGPMGTPLDLHWQLLFRDTMRAQFPVEPAELFAASREVALTTGSMRTLDAVDTVLHLCLHASLSGGHRLVWLKDVERAIAVDRPDWSELVRRARRRSLGPPAALVLSRARRSLAADVPAEVLAALLPSNGARAVLAAVDLAVPPERSSSRGSPARLLAKAARGSAADSAREVGRQVAGLRPEAFRWVREPAARGDPGAQLQEAHGGPSARAGFFDAVERAAR